MDNVDLIFKAFADETRLRILNLLRKGELCVCEIKDVLEITQSKASRHLTYLKNAGLVKHRREGLWMYYSLINPESGVHQTLINCVKNCLNEIDILKEDLKKLAQLKKRCN